MIVAPHAENSLAVLTGLDSADMLAVATVACRPFNLGIWELKHIYETEVVRSVNKVPIYGDTN
jgi:hypothetical protein